MGSLMAVRLLAHASATLYFLEIVLFLFLVPISVCQENVKCPSLHCTLSVTTDIPILLREV
jgi:hypothetical protein